LLPLRRAVLAVFSTALLLGLAWGCSASNDTNATRAGSGGNPGIGEAGNDEQILHTGSGEAGAGSLNLNPLCGKDSLCVPDKPGECSSYVPPATLSDASVDTVDSALSSQAGQSGQGGAAGESSAGAGGASGAAGAGAGAEAGAAGASAGASGGPSGVLPPFSCQVQRLADAPDSAVSQCAVVGSGGVNAPCLTSSDCGWDARHGALGCVGDASSGLCEPYCCKGDDSCAVGSYCAERPLRDALTNAQPGTAPTVMIPVCVPAENCDLSTPYPCPAGAQCACKSDTACVVMRGDGTTTCALPGSGKVGDACPCAWGYVCSVATNPNQCLKLCYTRGPASCGTGTCQASAELPDGWGVCVGTSLPSGG
jgi:hypothetical protein